MKDRTGSVGAVILAAGGSTRLGRPKQIEPYRGKSLLARTLDAAEGAGCDPIVCVLGAHADRIRTEFQHRSAHFVVNRHWERGMGSSIRCGIAALRASPQAAEILAAVLMVCDQAAISSAVIRKLLVAFDGQPGRRVAAEYGETVGVPALFERSLFDALERNEEQGRKGGARSILLADPSRLQRIPWPDGAWDIDTEDDLVNAE